jgi:pSer/pThr/pTyr-binding forkhead associated (FHA) protein
VCRLAPGGRSVLGRAPAADVVVAHPSVSRLHARIIWPEGRARPFVEDLESQNGVLIDGRRIANVAELRDGTELGLGSMELTVELVERHVPAIIDDETSRALRVRLFSESGPELEGALVDRRGLQDLLLDLERRRRTGTLTLADGSQLTLGGGRIVHARRDAREGMASLRSLLAATPPGPYSFTGEISIREAALDVLPSSLVDLPHAAEPA